MTHVPSGSAWKIWIQDSAGSTLITTESKNDTPPLPTPSLQVPYLGGFWSREIPRSVSSQATRWTKRGSCGVPRMSTGLTERLNSNVYAKVNVRTLLLIPTSSRPEKAGVLLKESPDTPGMKGNRGILIHFPF